MAEGQEELEPILAAEADSPERDRIEQVREALKHHRPVSQSKSVAPEQEREAAAETKQAAEETTKRTNWISRTLNRLSRPAEATPESPRKVANDAGKKEAGEVAHKAESALAKKVATNLATDAIAPEIALPVQTLLIVKKYWKPILILILIALFLSISAIAAALGIGQSGVLGSTFHQGSGGDTELTALANAGDIFARRALDAKDIPQIKAAMDEIEKQAKAKKPQDDEALKIVDTIRTKLTSYVGNDSTVDKQILTDVEDLLQQLATKGYGSVLTNYTTTGAAAAISKLMDSGRLTIAHPNDRAGILTGYIARAASQPGTPDPAQMNPMIPLMVLALDHDMGPMTVSSIIGEHPYNTTGTGGQSPHWCGNAMDISVIKGLSVNDNKSIAQQMLQWILDHNSDLQQHGIKVSQTIGPAQFGSLQMRHGQQVSKASDGYLHGHEDHVHIGFYPLSGACSR